MTESIIMIYVVRWYCFITSSDKKHSWEYNFTAIILLLYPIQ